ncbi:McrB family protein (plasmid) [Halorientalis pallida]|uniref:McrB family protein n=1 Tax=Halorientalis pallida TaxID=2479928 RepID=UPI003C6EDBCF
MADDKPSHRFNLGETYRRRDLHDQYGGNPQSGVSPCGDEPIIFLFTGGTGQQHGYQDDFKKDGTVIYTGEGQEGDMEFVRGNKAIRDHKEDDRELHLFEMEGDGEVRYLGQYEYADFEWVELPDTKGNPRDAIRFELAPVGETITTEMAGEERKDNGTEESVVSSNTEASTDPTDRKIVSIRINKTTDMREHFDATVLSDVSRDTVEPYLEVTFDRDDIRLWGNRASTVGENTVSRGDLILFFYDGEYEAVAEVMGTSILGPSAAEFSRAVWPSYDPDDPGNYVIYLSRVYDATIDLDRFWDEHVLDYSGHPLDGWTDLHNHLDAIVAEYGSIEGFYEEATGALRYDYWDLDEWDIDTDLAHRLERQLQRKGQVILYGPPGTGKTFTADSFARWWTGQQMQAKSPAERISSVTFHPSYSYEDFIEGYTIIVDNDDGATPSESSQTEIDEFTGEQDRESPAARDADSRAGEYGLKDGLFKEFCNEAESAFKRSQPHVPGSEPKYLFLIDEINRGNISKVLGENIKLLEQSKRGDSVRLSHSGEEFTIPPNVYVIGTMNTADQSIALLDAALRRRFASLTVPPKYEVLYNSTSYPFDTKTEALELVRSGSDELDVLQAASVLALEIINSAITETSGLGKGKRIGHTYLLPVEWEANADATGVGRDRALADVWRFDILPLLEEYYFGEFDRLQEDVFGKDDVELFDQQTRDIAEFSVAALREELVDLVTRRQELLTDAET